MKTRGEIEAEISTGMSHFEQEYMGRGPKEVRAHLVGDLVVVRLIGVLTTAEQHLVRTLPDDKGRDLLKEVRRHLIEIARPTIGAMIQGITGVKLVSLHYDISTSTGEEAMVFTMAAAPVFRETKANKPPNIQIARDFRFQSGAANVAPRTPSLLPSFRSLVK